MRYQNRWHMMLSGFIFGGENPDEMERLGDYQKWTPLEVHVYQSGVLGGFLAGVVSMAIAVIIELALSGKL